MSSFGYKIQPDKQIDLDQTDRQFAKFLLEHQPDMARCMACGSCAATCSAADATDMSLRRLIALVQNGQVENIRKALSKCMLCGKCVMVCPRGIQTRSLIMNMLRACNKLNV
jgi:heterodisulfide reductase subunit C